MYRIVEDLDDILIDINLALNGKIDDVIDPFYIGNGLSDRGELKTSEFIIYSPDNSARIVLPLDDFRELIISWKEFLES